MMKSEIKMTRQPDGKYIVTVDGASVECQCEAEVMSRVGHEMGVSYGKANKELFDKLRALEADNVKLTEERVKYHDWWYKLYVENEQMKKAICKCFLKAYKEG